MFKSCVELGYIGKMFDLNQSLFIRHIKNVKISELVNKCSNQTNIPFSKVYLPWLVFPHCWMLPYSPQSLKCHSSPGCLYIKNLGSPHRDKDMDICHVVGCVHVYTMFCQVFPQCPNDHHLVVPFGNPLLLHHLGIPGCWLELLKEYVEC